MRKSNKMPRRSKAWELLAAGLLMFALIWGSTARSDGPESHEKVTEGYEGSKRVKLLEKPVEAKSGETVKLGYIGDQRIRLRVIRKNEYTETRGWKGDEYIHVKERKE